MSELREEIKNYVDIIPDSKLSALRQLLVLITDEPLVYETDLTDEEREIIAQGMEEYKNGGFIPLDEVKKMLGWADGKS